MPPRSPRSGCLALLALVACSDEAPIHRLEATLAVEPETLDLGEVAIGSEAGGSFVLTNSGDRPAVISRLALESPIAGLSLGPHQPTMHPKAIQEIAVRYVPLVAATVDTVVSIASDADHGAALSVRILVRSFDPCVDRDGDGFGPSCGPGPDCDDAEPTIHPGATERCNAIDENCDGLADDGFSIGDRCTTTVTLPGGACTRAGVWACDAGGGATCQLDAAIEACDGLDNDCDGTIDEPFADLGTACTVPEGTCTRPGQIACAPDGTGAACQADPGAPASCCPGGQIENPAGVCCAPIPTGPCAVECTVDLAAGGHDCSGPIRVLDLAGQMALLEIDLGGRSSLEARVHACDPTNHWLDIADSPTCNGFGGDGSSSSNDAELHLSGSALGLYANDFVVAPASSPLYTTSLPITGCQDQTFSIADSRVQSFSPCIDVSSPYALRINPPADMEGTPDALWYVGLNRVVSDTSRSGTGVQSATFCLR